MDVVLNSVILLACFWGLARVCDDIFVPALEAIADKLKMNAEVAGATLMAIGSSAPELFTAILALSRIDDGAASLGSGTIVGSAIFNILVIVGASSLFLSNSYKLFWQPVVRDMLFYLLSVLLILFFFWDGKMVLWESGVLASIYVVYLVCVHKWSTWLGYTMPAVEVDHEGEKPIVQWCYRNKIKAFVGGIAAIGILSHFMIDAAIHVANDLGVPFAIIALTILAAGTSIPDLLSSLIAARKGKGGMAVSNAIGSNIFDIFAGIGIVYFCYLLFSDTKSIDIDADSLISSVILLFATIVSLTSMLLLRRWRLGRVAGYALIGLYLAYLVYIGINLW